MTIGFLFWLLMLLVLVLGLLRGWPGGTDPWPYFPLGMGLIVWVLFFLLGWKVFGFPIQG